MNKFREKLDVLIPKYARLPLIVLIIVNFVEYYVPKLIEPYRSDLHTLSTAFDDKLPWVPEFIFIYVLAYVQWIVGYIIIARESRERCYKVLTGVMVAKVITMIIFLAYPTTLLRPEVKVTGFTTFLTAFIYSMDTPTNLFPSPHCFDSWFCFRGAIGLKKTPKWYVWAQFFMTLLVFASVLLVKQHVWYDVVGGIAVAEAGQLISDLIHADGIWYKRDKKKGTDTDL